MVGHFLSLSARARLARYRNVMSKDTASMRTLRRALATIGSEERLATELNCSLRDLVAWLSGEKPAPNPAFIAALDIVASAGHMPRQRRARRG
jgi:hypothetical protein